MTLGILARQVPEVVGPSVSARSMLTTLMQRRHAAEAGRVPVEG